MSLKRTDLVYDLFYASNTDPMTADRIATLTIQLRDEAGVNSTINPTVSHRSALQ